MEEDKDDADEDWSPITDVSSSLMYVIDSVDAITNKWMTLHKLLENALHAIWKIYSIYEKYVIVLVAQMKYHIT